MQNIFSKKKLVANFTTARLQVYEFYIILCTQWLVAPSSGATLPLQLLRMNRMHAYKTSAH